MPIEMDTLFSLKSFKKLFLPKYPLILSHKLNFDSKYDVISTKVSLGDKIEYSLSLNYIRVKKQDSS